MTTPQLTIKLLDSYQRAALENARELLEEAKLLFSNDHFSRTYFLALASIEETGKAYSAFDAKGRNLRDGGVCKKIKKKFEDHSSKITSAFVGWLTFSDSPREAIKKALDFMVHLEHGREKSMYIDVKDNGSTLSIPNEVVRPVAARDCVNLAENCLHHTELYLKKNKPPKRTSHQDKYMCINQKNLKEVFGTEDFWWFYIHQREQGNSALEDSVVTYHDGFYKKRKKFKGTNS